MEIYCVLFKIVLKFVLTDSLLLHKFIKIISQRFPWILHGFNVVHNSQSNIVSLVRLQNKSVAINHEQ